MPTIHQRQPSNKPAFFRWMSVAVLIATGGFFVFFSMGQTDDELLQNARSMFRKNQFRQAEQYARRVLRREPGNSEALWISGRSCVKLKRYREAVNDLVLINLESSQGIEARLLAAELLHYTLCRFDEAEQAYLDVLQSDLANPRANDGLARLLAVCGRRSEAVSLILQLVRQRRASDLLMVLARESGAINDPELLERAHQASPNSAGPLLGLARVADLKRQSERALEFCRKAVEQSPDLVATHVELGRYLLQQNLYEELIAWRGSLPSTATLSPEIQKIIGFIELRLGNKNAALNAFLAAAQAAPDSLDVCYQISRLLFAAGDAAAAQVYVEQIENIRRLHEAQDRVLFLEEQPDAESLVQMIVAYERCGRLLEAYGWTQMACQRFPQNAVLQQLEQRLARDTEPLSLQLVPKASNPAYAIAGDHYEFPIATDSESAELSESDTAGDPTSGISFSELSDELGLSFHYENGGRLTRRMFEFSGGGVGAEDLDRDGYPDIVFSQGGVWELRGTSSNKSDALFRNVRGTRFEEVSAVSSFGNTDYGQGVAIGDIDQDGFPDILISSIGGPTLWMNSGDGTFRNQDPLPVTSASAEPWMTSCAIADLNHDSLPDIYLVGYLSGPDVFDRVCRARDGTAEICLPTVFPGEPDRLLVNDGSGGFINASHRLPDSVLEGKGLGVLVFDADRNGGAHLYVANDTTPNALLKLDSATGLWSDMAFASGVAVSGQGKSEGSMGIALGDPDADGIPDLVVTNFLNEASAFYHGLGNSVYRDDRQVSGLQVASLPVLGFGTQFLDADLDGNPELFVSNGHIDDLRHQGKPWQMPAQLFTIQKGQFRLLNPDLIGRYFQRNHLGRAVARIDWNVDGRPDLVLGNLHEPSVLLTNTTQSAGKSLRLRLVSIRGNREAVSATVTCRTENRSQVQQVTAGDGYQCSNEKTVILGCGSTSRVDELTIRWPSGSEQAMTNLSVSSDWVIVEDRPLPLWIPR